MGSAALRFRDVRPSVRAAPGNTTRLDDFWRYINLYVCMYVPGMYSADCSLISSGQSTTLFMNEHGFCTDFLRYESFFTEKPKTQNY